MTGSLHREIMTPSSTYTLRIAIVGVGCGLLAAGSMLALQHPATSMVAIMPAPEVTRVAVAVPLAFPIDVSALRAARALPVDLHAAFTAGSGSFVTLAHLTNGDDDHGGEAMPRHGTPVLHDDAGAYAAVAAVQPHDVPIAYRGWLGKQVRFDTGCEAKVTGFAVVARLSGDPAYAGGDLQKWTATNVLAHGTGLLAAQVDGCTGRYARDAALPKIVVPEVIEDARLVAAAKRLLIASTPGRETQTAWITQDQKGQWFDGDAFRAIVVRHPLTGVTWVSVHGHADRTCGGPDVNVWGLFRVEPDGSLKATQLRMLGDLDAIDQLIDLDGDGELELVGKGWLGVETLITRSSGDELDRSEVPYFGCPC